MRYLRHLLWSFSLLSCCVGTAHAGGLPNWKLGDSWHIKVHVPDGLDEKAPGSKPFDIHVVILGRQKVKGIDCIKVDFFLPGKKKPDFVQSFRYRVFIDPKDGFPRQAYSFKDYRSLPLRVFPDARILAAAPNAIPLDFLPLVEPVEAQAGNAKLTIKQSTKSETGMIEQTAILYLNEKPYLEIRETWKKGEKWWRTYERRREGKLQLRAWQVIKPPRTAKAPKTPKKSAPVKPAPRPPKGKVTHPPFVNETNDPLRADPRLQIKLTLKLRNPRVPHILDLLSRATKLDFSADTGIDHQAPVFSSAHWVNLSAWSIMTSLAECPKVRGAWEKTGTGYRLVRPGAVAAADSGDSLWPFGQTVTIVILTIVSMTFLALCGYAIVRKAFTKTPPAPSKTR